MNARKRIKKIQGPVDGVRVDTADGSKLRIGEPLGQLDSHGIQYPIFQEKRNPQSSDFREIAKIATYSDTSSMPRPKKERSSDPWRQRPRFIELVDRKVASGVSLEEIAKALGLSTVNSLTTAYRYDHSRIPKRSTIEKAAAYFGVPIAELYGPETDDDFGNIMGILGPGLTPEMRAVMIQMAKAGQVKAEDRRLEEDANPKK